MATYNTLANDFHGVANLLEGMVNNRDNMTIDQVRDIESLIRQALANIEQTRQECPGLMTDSELEFAVSSFEMQAYNSAPCGIQDQAADHLQRLQDEHQARKLHVW